MSEVSCSAVVLWFHCLERRGIPAERLLRGTAWTVESLGDRWSRIGWDDFVTLAERMEELVGGPEELERVGAEFFDVQELAPLNRLAGLFLSPWHLYYAVDRYFGPLLFSNVRSTLRDLGGGRLSFELCIDPAYRDCPQFFRISKGTFAAYPLAFGDTTLARVDLDLAERVGRYEIELPSPRVGLLRRIRRSIRAMRDTDRVLSEIGHHHSGLQRSVSELREAKRRIAQQAEELTYQKQQLEEQVRELHETQEALRRSESRWRSVVDDAPDFVVLVDREGVVQFVNRGMDDVPGGVGRPLRELADDAFNSQFDVAVRDAWEHRRATCFETDWTSPSGREWSFSNHVGPVVENDEVVAAILIARDITEARRAARERLELERQLLHRQKLESLGVLAGGIAHDFNNLLAGIVGNAEMVDALIEADSPARAYLDRVQGGAMRAAGLVEQMLAYAGRARSQTRPADVSALVEEVTDLLRAALPKSADMRLELERGLPCVDADVAQVQQVVMNLVTNAAEALPERRGAIRVSTRLEQIDAAPEDLVHGSPVPGPHVVIEVSDDGVGMDPMVRRRMFEPFFTTKATGRGLGLAAVQGIVRAHRGGLVVRSGPGEGTTCRVLLPAAAGTAEAVSSPGGAPDLAGRAVLVVDDEPTVRESVRAMLEHQGLRVLVAEDGDVGIAVFEAHADEIELVLLDLTMPGRSGAEVFRSIRALRPTAKVILSSAWDARDTTAELTSEGLAGFIRKPYRRQALLAALSAVLTAE